MALWCEVATAIAKRIYDEVKAVYPDVNLISNCNAVGRKLDHPAEVFDWHVSRPSLFANPLESSNTIWNLVEGSCVLYICLVENIASCDRVCTLLS